MKTIKTYEGFFDFFKFSMESKVEACKEVLSGKDYQMKKSPVLYRGSVDKHSDEFIFTYPYIVDDKECKVEIRIHEISKNLVSLTTTGSGLGQVLDRQSQGIAEFNKKEFIDALKRAIDACENRIRVAVEAEEFFLDYPEEDIKDYLVDLRDELEDEIKIQKNYYFKCWDIHFSIPGTQNREEVERRRSVIEDQIVKLGDLLNGVHLKLVQPQRSKLTKGPGSGYLSWSLQIHRK